jgi:hypothetical protein
MGSVTLNPPITCRGCGLAIITTKRYENCPSCGESLTQLSLPAPGREPSTYDCPVCDEPPASCTCLRVSVRRRIARALSRRAAA